MSQDDWSLIRQVVVQSMYQRAILSLAHDHQLAGHLGINETCNRVLCHFFWPGLKRDVVRYASHVVCHVTGKPHQMVRPAPLYPIPAVSEPFERVIVDSM